MKITIDLRSAVIGLGASVVLTLTLGAVTAPTLDIGRYQVSAGGDNGLIVDTATGQVWSGNLNETRFSTDPDFKRVKTK